MAAFTLKTEKQPDGNVKLILTATAEPEDQFGVYMMSDRTPVGIIFMGGVLFSSAVKPEDLGERLIRLGERMKNGDNNSQE